MRAVVRGSRSDRAGHRTGRPSRRPVRWPGRPGRLRIPASRVRRRSATAGSSLASVSRMTQARWPSSVATAMSVSASSAVVVASRSRARERAVRPRERLLDVGLGVTDEPTEELQRLARQVRVAAGPPVAVGHRRDRGTDEPAFPRRGAVDELLELGPAIRLGGDPDPVRMGERVDRDPVAGLTRGAAHQLPRPLRLHGQRPFEDPEGEPARLEVILVEQAIGQEQEGRRTVVLRGDPETARDGGHQRPADAVDGTETGCDTLLSLEVCGVGELREPGDERVRERVRVVEVSRRGRCRSPRRRSRWAATKATA